MKRTRFWVGVLAAAALLSVGAILLLGPDGNNIEAVVDWAHSNE